MNKVNLNIYVIILMAEKTFSALPSLDGYDNIKMYLENKTEQNFKLMCMELYRTVAESKNTSQSRPEASNFYSFWNIRPKVWIASIISVFVISAVGLLVSVWYH
ncbi:unnamed protein product [Heterobilharzia americana]|nr:unnamed protein product [Heterobilharzia americana]